MDGHSLRTIDRRMTTSRDGVCLVFADQTDTLLALKREAP